MFSVKQLIASSKLVLGLPPTRKTLFPFYTFTLRNTVMYRLTEWNVAPALSHILLSERCCNAALFLGQIICRAFRN